MGTSSKRKKIIIILCLAAVTLASVLILVTGRTGLYESAVRLVKSGEYEEAYEVLKKLDGYKDSGVLLEQMLENDPMLAYRSASKGDVLSFGAYEQDNDPSNGREPLEWVVIDRIDDEILLLSVFCIDCMPYNAAAFEPVTWETSQIRRWLNEDFYNSAFSDDQKQHILLMENQNPDQSALGTEGGADTLDHIYLLGEKEARIYIGDEISQEYTGRAKATQYAMQHGAYIDETGMTQWWLRSPGAYEYAAQFVETSGIPYISGAYVDISCAVRPVLWLDCK